MSDPSTSDSPDSVCPVSKLTPQSVSWLWESRLGIGKLSILDGDPGLGKSLLALDLCARLSTGRPWPDGKPGPGPARSLVLAGEDGPEDTVRPRLAALGADLDNVFVLRPGRDGTELPRFPADMDRLRQAVKQVTPKLVVLDPIMTFFDASVVTANDQRVRAALQPLGRLADEYDCTLLLVRNLNKSRGSHAIYRGGGSIGIVGVCRSAWLVGIDPVLPQRRVLAQIKNNLAPPQPSLAYELLTQPGAPVELIWKGPSPWTANQLLGARGLGRRERARLFLAAMLEDGPRTSQDIWTIARAQGFSERTLRRARHDLNAQSVRVWTGPTRLNYWLLPGQKLPDGVTAEDGTADLEQWLAPLREMYPSPTPLDD
jgi:hypothetical protein